MMEDSVVAVALRALPPSLHDIKDSATGILHLIVDNVAVKFAFTLVSHSFPMNDFLDAQVVVVNKRR